MRIWLDLIFKAEIQRVVDWSKIDKEDYLLAMERSPIKDIEIKHLLKNALTTVIIMRDIVNYHFFGAGIRKMCTNILAEPFCTQLRFLASGLFRRFSDKFCRFESN